MTSLPPRASSLPASPDPAVPASTQGQRTALDEPWQPDYLPEDHPPIANRRVGVLLVNLGTPDAPTRGAVARYLTEFLSDRRVVELPTLLWQPLLRGVIVPLRAGKSAHAYQQIWTEAGSPLATITTAQAHGLFDAFGPDVIVDHAMRYGARSISDRLSALHDEGCDRILIAALYPQYSGATTATVHDAAFAALAGMRWQPAIRTLPPYYDDPVHIAALAAHMREALHALDFTPEVIVASFHSMPRRTLERGDPYHCQCVKTARLLGEALGRPLAVSFQSRLGRAKWLEPSTESVLRRLAGQGTRQIAVVTPGFAADNLETLEEIGMRGKQTFLDAGGEAFAALPCLNASDIGLKMLKTLIARQLAGWETAF